MSHKKLTIVGATGEGTLSAFVGPFRGESNIIIQGTNGAITGIDFYLALTDEANNIQVPPNNEYSKLWAWSSSETIRNKKYNAGSHEYYLAFTPNGNDSATNLEIFIAG